ncbi:MAG: cupredoxin domain-containing protein [Actinobacteria bacterium]|nr:cupredoxin domain-containing protein [Actinomycetota bacterium]
MNPLAAPLSFGADFRLDEVSAGDTVIWVNEEESTPHTVTAGSEDDPSGKFDSGNLDSGDTFEFTFEEPGTYEYYCDIHPGSMSGTVTVS